LGGSKIKCDLDAPGLLALGLFILKIYAKLLMYASPNIYRYQSTRRYKIKAYFFSKKMANFALPLG